ncbi:MAG: hypothetical protein KDH96_10835, partial [Candidatus Riesia sp.]|nr:hypothetical protein [Candidatus Riesia sp.]
MKLLSITPHLSTGGAPQVLVKRIELIKDVFDIYVVEYSNISDRYIVQKNMIKELLGIDKLITLGENKFEILNVIKDIDPDIIHFEEIPEMFMDYNISKKIYSGDRKYKIFETTHSSDFNVNNKIFLPDKFLFVSQYNSFKFNKFGVPIEVIEYPIEKKKVKKSDKEKYMSELGMDPSYKHVLNVGLFTPRKNQAYSFDISRELGDEKIIVHFVGNQADNFKHYWEPLMKRKPKNSVVWGERSDVYKFYIACDAFLFTSRGFKYDKELNPLVIKEALEHNMKLFLFPLDVYCGKYDDDPNVKYLTGNLTVDSNMVKDFLFEEKNDSETIDPFDIKIIKIEDKNDS